MYTQLNNICLSHTVNGKNNEMLPKRQRYNVISLAGAFRKPFSPKTIS